jgi:hypothetical protein
VSTFFDKQHKQRPERQHLDEAFSIGRFSIVSALVSCKTAPPSGRRFNME